MDVIIKNWWLDFKDNYHIKNESYDKWLLKRRYGTIIDLCSVLDTIGYVYTCKIII